MPPPRPLNPVTEGPAKAFGPTVRVNTLMAGPFLTDVSHAWNFDGAEQPFGHRSLQRAGDPREIVGAAVLLKIGSLSSQRLCRS